MADNREPRHPRRIFVTTPGFEAALVAELREQDGVWGGQGALASAAAPGQEPGIVNAGEPSAEHGPLDPVFARQQLPAALEQRASSVAALAEAIYAQVETAVDDAGGPFTIHAFARAGAEPSLGSRAQLIASELLARLRQRRRRATRQYRLPEQAAAAFGETNLLIQILLPGRDRAWVSTTRPRPIATGGWDVAPWPGGAAPVADDRRPPSRAYRKLEEAFAWMAAEPRQGELCVDLGGAPGGWSYTALRRGAHVIAVDRAPLEPPVRGDPRLTMLRGNAFTYEPPPSLVPVDWLLSDVICEPARALSQIERWLRLAWCRRLVMTVKFKGSSGYGILADIRAVLGQAACPQWRIKHLQHNKNEVTVMAVASPARFVPGSPRTLL